MGGRLPARAPGTGTPREGPRPERSGNAMGEGPFTSHSPISSGSLSTLSDLKNAQRSSSFMTMLSLRTRSYRAVTKSDRDPVPFVPDGEQKMQADRTKWGHDNSSASCSGPRAGGQ